jgi:HlyD family secretion protein
VQRAQADVLAFKSKLYQAERDWERAQRIGPSDALAQSSYDAYESAFQIAKANVVVSEAQVEQAKAAQEQAQANLERAQRNLSYCTIISPVTGVIIDRRVNIGQTVVASLTAPSLFLIAKDLTQLEVWIAVNEADIAMVKIGQPVAFNVDSLPGETFRGEVRKVRLKASMTQNVVTYTVEVTCDNSSRKMLPYMTANARFEVDRRDDVLAVPNMALRYTPAQDYIAPEHRRAATTAPAPGRGATTREGGERSMIWVRAGEFVKPIRVMAGVTDGAFTEVSGEGLSEGMEIVVGEVAESSAAAPTSSNPFAPQFGRSRRGR